MRLALTILTSMGKLDKAAARDRPPFQAGCPQIPLWNGLTGKPRSGLTSLGEFQIWDGVGGGGGKEYRAGWPVCLMFVSGYLYFSRQRSLS